MFFVFNKDKIKAYLVSLGTVVILFIFSIILSQNKDNKVLSTSTYYNNDNTINNVLNNTINNLEDKN